MAKSMIVDLILHRMLDVLKEGLQTTVDPNLLTYADVVKIGLLQTDKTSKNVQIGISGGDHEAPDYRDSIITDRDLQDIGIEFPGREVGGGQLWWRRGVVRVECFFIRERLTEEAAFTAGYEVLGALEELIERTDLNGLVDDFNEKAICIFCYGNTFFESGGPPKSYIFRGKVFWTVLTERP